MLKNNKLVKLVLSFTLIIAIVSIATMCNAYTPTITATSSAGTGLAEEIGGAVLGIVSAIGMAVALIMLVWLGVKYVMASPDGKADIKKQAFAYILGAVLIFGASTIIGYIKTFIDENLKEETKVSSSYVQTIDLDKLA